MAVVDVSLSFSNNIISPNIADPFTITVTNNDPRGRSIKIFTCKLVVIQDSVEYQVGPEYAFMATSLVDYITVMGPKTIRNDQFRSYQANGTSDENAFDCLNLNNLRALQVKVKYEASTGQETIYTSGAIDVPNVYAINRLIVPKVENLAFSRCNDQGEKYALGTKLLTTLKTSFGSPNDRSSFEVVITQNSGNTITIPAGDSRLDSFYNGITDSNIFISNFTVNTNQKYNMTVQLTDGYESSSMTYTVPSSFVNVHLSAAANGGVAFGKLSSADDITPKFECEYPVYLASTLTIDGNITINQKSITLKAGNIYITDANNNNKVVIGSDGGISAAGGLSVTGSATIGGTSSVSVINGTTKAENLYVNPDNKTGCGLIVNGDVYCASSHISIDNTECTITRIGEAAPVFTFNNSGFHFSDPVELSPNMQWANMSIASGITSPNTDYFGGGRLRVGYIGDHVFISGSVSARPGSSDVVLGSIPNNYSFCRPNHNYYALRPCSGARIARLFIRPNGDLILEWVRNLSDGDRYASAAIWIDCNFDYWTSY